jgi:hypothetical protein
MILASLGICGFSQLDQSQQPQSKIQNCLPIHLNLYKRMLSIDNKPWQPKLTKKNLKPENSNPSIYQTIKKTLLT